MRAVEKHAAQHKCRSTSICSNFKLQNNSVKVEVKVFNIHTSEMHFFYSLTNYCMLQGSSSDSQ